MDTIRDTYYRTTDTALAAYLKSCGYKHIDTDVSNRRAIFLFETVQGLDDKVRDFELMKGDAEKIVIFFHNYKALIQQIHILRDV